MELDQLVGAGTQKTYVSQPALLGFVGAFLQTIGFDINRNISQMRVARR